MNDHSFLVEDQKFIEPLRCEKCSGNAHLTRRSPHAAKSLEIRVFECPECGCQTQRIVTGEGGVPAPRFWQTIPFPRDCSALTTTGALGRRGRLQQPIEILVQLRQTYLCAC